MSDVLNRIDVMQKRCSRGVSGYGLDMYDLYEQANDMLADCHATLGGCRSEIERLRARVEELEATEKRLEDVVRLAAACDRNEDGPYPEEVMTAAGRERCEKCQGTGSVSEFKSGAVQGYVSRNCDCCINGWREANDE
jgi:hypothetical protein